nr:hypothetical protein [Bacillus velezensis]
MKKLIQQLASKHLPHDRSEAEKGRLTKDRETSRVTSRILTCSFRLQRMQERFKI